MATRQTQLLARTLMTPAVALLFIWMIVPLALLLDQPVIGRNFVRLMVIAPFFVMPTVSALVWKNLLMHPVSGLFAWIATLFGAQPIDWFNDAPLLAIILIVSWQWLPFATLILLTALQSLDEEQKEAADMDGASAPGVGVIPRQRSAQRVVDLENAGCVSKRF